MRVLNNVISSIICLADRPGKKKITLTRFLRNFKTHRRDKSRSQQNVSARVRIQTILLFVIRARIVVLGDVHFVLTTVGGNTEFC